MWARAQLVRCKMSGDPLDTGTVRGGAPLESEIPSKRQHDVAQAGQTDGCVRTAGHSHRQRGMRPGRAVLVAFAPIAGAAARARAERVPPPLQSAVYTDIQPDPTTSVDCILWLDVLHALPVGQAAINHNNMAGVRGILLLVTKDRLSWPASLGEKVATRRFSP
jgi:hypothetical protein